MPDLSPPPFSFRHNAETGYFEIPWQRFFLQQQQAVAASAPAGARYFIAEAEPGLPNAQNLGLGDTGWLHLVISGGAAIAASFPVVYQDLAPSVDVTIPAGFGAIVPDHFTIGAHILTVEAGAVFEVT